MPPTDWYSSHTASRKRPGQARVQQSAAFSKLGCQFTLDSRGLQLAPIMRQLAIAMDELGPLMLYNGAEPNFCIPQSNFVLLFSLQYPLQDNKVLESPMVKRLVQWLPGTQPPQARTARAFHD